MLPVTFDQLRTARLRDAGDGLRRHRRLGLRRQGVLGQPLWRLWGGYRDRIPMIGIGGYYGTERGRHRQETWSSSSESEHGMVGMKFKIGAEAARGGRRAAGPGAPSFVGDDFLFVVDANQGYTVREALAFLGGRPRRGLELRWFEEPTRWHADWRGLRDVRLKGNVESRPARARSAGSACGDDRQRGDRRLQLRRVLGRRADRVAAGRGPGPDLRRPARATTRRPRSPSHLLASVPNGTYVEAFTPERDPIFWEMVTNRKPLEDGKLVLPQEPGLGWELDTSSSSGSGSIAEAIAHGQAVCPISARGGDRGGGRS